MSEHPTYTDVVEFRGGPLDGLTKLMPDPPPQRYLVPIPPSVEARMFDFDEPPELSAIDAFEYVRVRRSESLGHYPEAWVVRAAKGSTLPYAYHPLDESVPEHVYIPLSEFEARRDLYDPVRFELPDIPRPYDPPPSRGARGSYDSPQRFLAEYFNRSPAPHEAPFYTITDA